MKITDRSTQAVNTIIENLNMIIDVERESLERVNPFGCTKDYSPEEELKYVIFQQMVCEMCKNAKSCQHLLEMSDAELRDMVEREDMTVRDALANVIMNMADDMMK